MKKGKCAMQVKSKAFVNQWYREKYHQNVFENIFTMPNNFKALVTEAWHNRNDMNTYQKWP